MVENRIGDLSGWRFRLEWMLKAGILALVALVPLVYGGTYLSDFFSAKYALLHIGIGLLVGIWVFQCRTGFGIEAKRQPYLLPLIAYASISLCSLAWALNAWQGLEVWLTQAWLLAFFLLVANYFYTPRAVWRLLWTIALVSLIVSLIGLLQYQGIHLIPFPHARWGNFGVSTLGNPNFVAHYLELSIILVIGMLIACRRRVEKVGLGALLVVELYYLLAIRSRGGWLALGAGLVTLIIFYRSLLSRRVWLTGGLIILVLALMAWVLIDRVPTDGEGHLSALVEEIREISDRALSTFDPEHFSVLQRRLVWADTIELIADQPVLGVGTGNFEFSLPMYRTTARQRSWEELIPNRPHMPYYAHNEYLEVWAENGIFGLGAVLWLLGSLLWVGRRVLQSTTETAPRALQASFLAAMVAALTHGFFSLNFQDPTSALHFWLIAGLAVRGGIARFDIRPTGQAGVPSRWFALGAVLPVALGGYWGLCILIGDYYYFDGQRKYYDFQQPNRAGLAFAQAIRWREHEFRYHHMLGLVDLIARRFDPAIRSLDRAEQLHPNNVAGLRLWGQALHWSGRDVEAISALHRAIKLNPLDPRAYPFLARSYHAAGQKYRDEGNIAAADSAFQRAIEIWHQALSFDPENADHIRSLGIGYFSAGLFDDAESALLRAVDLRPGDGVTQGNLGAVYLRQGRLDEAETAFERALAIDSLRAEWWGNLSLLYEKQERSEAKEAALNRAIRLDPVNLRWHLRLIELLHRQGRIEAALRVAENALEAQPQNERIVQMLRELRLRVQKEER